MNTLTSNESDRRDTEIIKIKTSQNSVIETPNNNNNKPKSRLHNRQGNTIMCCYSKNEYPRIVIGPDCKYKKYII